MEDEEREQQRRAETVRIGIRLTAMGLVVLALFSVVVFRLWSLQVLQSAKDRTFLTSVTTQPVAIQPTRGLILARNGQVIVSNKVEPVVTLSRVQAASDPGLVKRLAVVLGLKVSDIQTTLNDQQISPYVPAPVQVGPTENVIVYLSEHRAEFPGVHVTYVGERQYPLGTLAAQTLGYVADINSSELAQLKRHGYQQGDVIGQSGVEYSYERYLRGSPGVRDLLVDASGNPVGTKSVTPSRPGRDLVLNLSVSLQQAAETYLSDELATLNATNVPANNGGAVVVLDAQTGAVLALASNPTYDPAWWVGGISTAHYQQITSTASKDPLLNRAMQGLYPPGSTFKLATATAALNAGLISPYTYINDPGAFTIPPPCSAGCVFNNNESESCGSCDLQTALTISDDVFFYTLGYDFYTSPGVYGKEPIQKTAQLYGLGKPTGIDLPGEYYGQVDGPTLRVLQHQQAPKAFPNTYYGPGDALNTAFGQGETVITPLQLANAYATFANGGTRYAPEVGAALVSANGKTVKKIAPRVIGHVTMSASSRAAIMAGLEGVTTQPKGTACLLQPPVCPPSNLTALHYPFSKFPIAGKTGTSQVNSSTNSTPDAWFVGFGPTSNPKYVIAAVVPNGGYGATAAAPIVVKLFEYLIAHPIAPLATTVPTGAG